MNENNKICDLCGLDVDVSGFQLKTIEGEKVFCCEGCKGIYQMLNESLILDEEHQNDQSL